MLYSDDTVYEKEKSVMFNGYQIRRAGCLANIKKDGSDVCSVSRQVPRYRIQENGYEGQEPFLSMNMNLV